MFRFLQKHGYTIPLILSQYVPGLGGHFLHSVVVLFAVAWSLWTLFSFKKWIYSSRAEKIIIFVTAVVFVSCYFSVNKSATLHHLSLIFTPLFLIPAMVVLFSEFPEERKTCVQFIFILALWKTIEAVIYGLIDPGTFFIKPFSFPNANFYGVLLVLSFLCFLGESRFDDKKNKTFVFLAATIPLIIVLKMNLMGAFLAYLIGISMIFSFKKKMKGGWAIPLVAVLFVLFIMFSEIFPKFLQNNPYDNARFERLIIWKDSLRLLSAHLFVGTGLGNFGEYYEAFQTLPGRRVVSYAHNEYLQVFCELGLILGVFFGYLFLKGLLFLWSKGKQFPGISSSVLVLCVWAFFDFIGHGVGTLVIVSLLLSFLFSERSLIPLVSSRKKLSFIFGCFIGVLCVLEGASFLSHSFARQFLKKNKQEKAYQYFRLASFFNPYESHFLDDQASVLVTLNRREEAKSILEKAIKKRPRDFWMKRRLSILTHQLEGPEKAIEIYKTILSLAPQKPQFYQELGDLYKWAGDPETAKTLYEKMDRLTKVDFDGWKVR